MRNGTVSHKKKSICLIPVLVLALMFTACGSGNKSANANGTGASEGSAGAAQENPLAGNYEIVETTGTDGLSSETIEIMKLNDMTITLVLRNDSTGTLDLLGEATELTYDSTAMTMNLSGKEYTFAVDGDKLTIHQDSGDMVFQKG